MSHNFNDSELEKSSLTTEVASINQGVKGKRSAEETRNLEDLISQMYQEGHPDAAIAQKCNTSEAYVSKFILKSIRAGKLKPVNAKYSLVTHGTTLKSIAESLDFAEVTKNTSFRVEREDDKIIITINSK